MTRSTLSFSFGTLLLVLTGLLLHPAAVNAQQEHSASSGSPYSGIAFGEPADLLSPYTAGMGLTGVSTWDPYTVNNANPALWGLSGFSQGSISIGLQNHVASEGGATAEYSRFTFDQFQLVFPVVRSRLGLSFAFLPVTRSAWTLRRDESFGFEGFSNDVDVRSRVDGSGGINKMELGVGWRPSSYFSVGYAGSIHFASLGHEYTTLFSSTRFNSLAYNEKLTGISTGHRFGLHGRYAGLLSNDDSVFLGAALTLPVHFGRVDRSLTAFREVGGNFREVDLIGENGVRSGKIELPLEFNLGLTYNPVSSVSISAEYLQQYWDQAVYSFNTVQEQYLVDRSRIGLGAQFHPYRRSSRSFFSRFKYSAGVTWDSGHLMIDKQNIETLLLHAGIGILPGSTRSSVDLSFQYGFRGSGTNSLVQETIWGFRLSLNLAEFMFVQPRFQ